MIFRSRLFQHIPRVATDGMNFANKKIHPENGATSTGTYDYAIRTPMKPVGAANFRPTKEY